MSKMLRYVRLIIPAITAIFFAPAALAVICTTTTTGGSWNTAGNWSCGHVPVTADDVVIDRNFTVNVATAAVQSVTITAGTLTQSSALNTAALPAGALNISGGTFNSTANMTIGGATTVSAGTFRPTGNNTRIYTGLVTISGGTWSGTNRAATFRGGITYSSGTFTAGTGVHTFDTNAQSITGTVSIPSVTVTGVTLTNNGTFTIATALIGNGELTNSATGTLNIGGTSTITTLTAIAAGNTVNYTGAAQTAKVTTYSNLTLSGSGAKTFATTPTVNSVLSMEGTATVAVTTGVVTYGANATLQYNTATARAATAEEWITPFVATGGIIIANTGVITMGAAKVFNTGIPLTINAGATLTPAASLLTLGGDFNNLGTFTSGSGGVTITGTVAQAIDGFTSTGTVSMTKTAGTATLQGNVNGGALILNGTGGTLNLGAGLTHTFTGAWTRTNGTLDGGSNTLNIGGSCSGAGGAFTAGTGTINWNAAGAQTVCPFAYNNLGLSNSGAKTMTGVTAIGGNLSISGSATMTGNAAFTVNGAWNYSSSGTTTLTNVTPISIGSFNQTAGTITAGANTVTVSGNWNETGAFTSSGTVAFNGATAQTISGTSPVTFSTLNVANTASPNITLAATNVTVATLVGTATLTPSCPDLTLTSVTPAQVLHSCPAVVNSINRANPDNTSAATVSWTVTFNKSVTGVDATAFILAASGVSGAYITTVAGSGTTWTVAANTGIGSGTLGLNQTGPGAVVPILSGTFTGQVYTTTATPALAEYRMDEASWNGTANEVVDSSGSGNHAQAFNSASTSNVSPAITGSPGTCRYGVFDDGGTTITKGYVQTPLPNLTTDFTVAAWIRTTNNTVAGQRILIDDQNNDGGYGFSLGDGAAGILRFYSRGITPIILDSTYTIANNTWYFVAAVVDITNKKRTIYVFDVAGALLNSTTETAWTGGAWGTDAGPVSIGAETNASGELPASFHFRGNLDEVRVYQKVLNQSALVAIATQAHTCPVNVPDHLVIQSAGSGVTCTPSTLTVVACADASCGTLYTLGVSGTFSATGTPTVNWDGTTGGATGAGFIIPAGSSNISKNVQVTKPGTVTFGISTPAPAPSNSTSCNFGSPSCTFTAADAGFLVSAPNHVAEATSTLTVKAIKKADDSLACVPAFQSVPKSVNLKCAYVNPVSGSLPVRVGSDALNSVNDAAAACDSTGRNISLSFDATGVATPTLQYADVGKMQIDASFSGAAGTIDAGLGMTGSGTFIAAPAAFVISGVTAGPIKAGSSFSATITAKNYLGNTTANFGNESSAQTATLTFTKCQPIGTSSSNGTFSGSATFTNGVANASNLNWSEVGNGDLAATNSSYLGSGLGATGNTGTSGTVCSTGTAPKSGNVGRFIPDHFDTVVTGPMTCPSGLACATGGLVYSGQAFSTNVYARNALGALTQNYDGTVNTSPNFAKNVTLRAWNALGSTMTENPPAATPGVMGSNMIFAAAFSQGATVLPGTPGAPVYTFGTTPTTPTDIYARATDADASSLRTVTSTSIEGGVTVVSGRVKISNAYGSELLPLTLAATAQYYTANGWANSITDSIANLVLLPAYDVKKSGVTTGTTAVTLTPVSSTLSAGKLTIRLAPPTGGATGTATITPVSPAYLPLTSGTGTFGVYSGNNNFIYQREAY